MSEVQLHLGDCLDFMRGLADKSVDCILTDPPYGIGKDGQKKSTGGHSGRKAYDFKGWDLERPRRLLFDEMRRVSKIQVIWGGNYFADYLPATSKWLVWDKGQRIRQSDGELAWTSLDGALRIYTLNRVALLTDGAVHPTQKPVSLIQWCFEQVGLTPPCTVFDPYMGSGTTGVVCMHRGFDFIGCENDPEYFFVAEKRIAEAQLQVRMPI